ncbi:MAG TPA: ABC transporter permease, partial [Polyangiaceae bacterium]|nr:ABC transporter permease [Polyangiaceae bacterium]
GATAKVKSDIGKLGDNLLIVSPGAGRRSATYTPAPLFTLDDVAAVRREVTGVEHIAPTAGAQQLVVWGNKNHQSGVTGTTNDYLAARGYSLARGREFSPAEQASGRAVCMLGATVRKELFGASDPLGASVRVGKVSCLVIGELASKGQSGMGQDQDDLVLMPLRTVQRRLIGDPGVNAIFLSAKSSQITGAVERQLEGLLRQRRRIPPGAEDDFSVRDMQEIAEAMSSATGTLTALLGAIAAVSLLVGGIGIMNIMLVNVTERTREIGIRLAIGALARDVLFQFLVEAVVLSTLGGLIGIAAGLGMSWSATRALGLPFLLQPEILLLAFGFSAFVGVLFGFLPARKAARLNPIEALRYE